MFLLFVMQRNTNTNSDEGALYKSVVHDFFHS